MTRPGRRLRYMLLFLLLGVTAAAGVNRIANPFGIWRSFTVDKSYLKEIKVPRVSMPYRLRREQPSTVIVGSSRTLDGMPIEYGHRDGVLNASLPGATLDEIAFIIDVAIERSRPTRLIWGVDFYAFDENQAGFRDSETRLRLEGDTRLLIVEALLSMETFELSRKLLARAIAGQKGLPPERELPVPWSEQDIRASIEDPGKIGLDRRDWVAITASLKTWTELYSNYRFSDRLFALYRSAVAHARQAGIEVILYVPPLNRYELEIIRQTGRWETFQRWKRQLLSVGPYWDFSGYNELSRSDPLFSDPVHFKPVVGHAILRQILGKGCAACGDRAQVVAEAGVWVSAETVDRHLATQTLDGFSPSQQDLRYSTLVEGVLRQ
jgi:hypothetical protein